MCANKCHVYLTLCNAKVSIQRFTSYFFVSKVRVLPLFLLVNGMKKILIYSQWILNTYNGKVLHYFLLWVLFVNTFIKCKHLVGRNGRPKQESDQANVSRVPDVAKGYPILLSHQSQSHQQVSFLSLTVSDAVESLISFQYQEENMTKTTKTSKQICLYIGLTFFLAKRGWGERKKGYTL